MNLAVAPQAPRDVVFRARAAALVALDADCRAHARDNAERAQAGTLTGADVDVVLAMRDELRRMCEEFRLVHFPKVHRVVAVHGRVFAVSPSARRIRAVFDVEEPVR